MIIGGGDVGCETALFFRRNGSDVTLIEKGEKLMPEDPIAYNTMVLERMLCEEGVAIFTKARVAAVEESEVAVERESGGIISVRADTVIHAAGFEPLSETAGLLRSVCRESFVIGDCVEPRRLHNAIAEGFEAGIRIGI